MSEIQQGNRVVLRGTILSTGDGVVVIATEDGLLQVPRAALEGTAKFEVPCAWLDPDPEPS